MRASPGWGVRGALVSPLAGGLGFKSRAGQIGSVSPTARHRCDVPSELCSPGAKPRKWAPALVTRFGVIPRVYNEDLIFDLILMGQKRLNSLALLCIKNELLKKNRR